MESKCTRYTEKTVQDIANGLSNPNIKSASQLADELGLDVSGLIKHVKKYRRLVDTAERNKCGKKIGCKRYNDACGGCFYAKNYGCRKRCANCKVNCNDVCPDFSKEPSCPSAKKFPYVCNGCPRRHACRLCKFVYDPAEVWKSVQANRSEPRKGAHADAAELIRLSELLVPLVKGKHQSLGQIYETHGAEIRWSYPTVLSFIDQGLIPGLANIDLTKRVKYPKHYKKAKAEPRNTAFLPGRTYDDFVAFVSDNPSVEVVEMDTVVSCRGDDSCLLTLLFRKSNFMLAFKLERKDKAEVARAFSWIKKQLGAELYAKHFRCVLTDNGSEFADPLSVEVDEATGEKLCSLFYCDPGKSGQKGKIEKNHVELRKVFPKGCGFSAYAQGDVNVALSHVNSEPRALLNGNCPGDIARVFLDGKVIALNGFEKVDPDLVNLHPSLLRKE